MWKASAFTEQVHLYNSVTLQLKAGARLCLETVIMSIPVVSYLTFPQPGESIVYNENLYFSRSTGTHSTHLFCHHQQS